VFHGFIAVEIFADLFPKDDLKKMRENSPMKLWVTMDPAREMYQTAIGAHPDQSEWL
jgi:hypothetical protein